MAKYLRPLGTLLVTAVLALVAWNGVWAAPPEYLQITHPTVADWLARKSGAAITLSFDYTSNPAVPPATTRALGRVGLVGADPANPSLDTVLVEAWQDIPNGTGLSASINLTIPTSQPEGSYDARVILTNSDGSPITDWELGAIIVDNSAPNAPTNLAITDDTNPGPDGYINTTTPTFTWTAATDNGNPPSGIAKYWIQIDGKFTWREVAGTSYTVPVADALADDAYTARVKAEDKAGNVGPEATINFTVDTAAPAAPTVDAEPTYTKGTSNTITWPAVTDPVTGTCEYYAEYTTDSTWGTVSGNSGWMTDTIWTVTGLTSGTMYYYRVKARDLAGNVTTSGAEFSTQDHVAPSFGSPSPADGAWVNTATPTISISVSDNVGGAGIDGSSATISIDGGTPVAATYDGVSGTISYTPAAPLAEGTHTVTISVKDAAYPPVGPGPDGNLATVTWSFGVDTVAPTLSGQLPTGNINISNPTLSVDFSDATSGYDATASPTTFTLDSVAVTPDSEPLNGALTGQITKATSGLAEGSHSVVIQARDLAGNLSNSLSWSFFVDTVAPTPPTVTVTSPTNDTTPTFTFNGASDPAPSSGLASYTIEIWSGGAKVRGPYTAAYAVDPFSWTVPDADALGDGSYEIRVWSVDAAGNVSTTYGSATVAIDIVRPHLYDVSPLNYININNPTLSAFFDDTWVPGAVVSGYGSTILCTLDGTDLLPVTTEPASGAPTGTITKTTSGLGEGSHTAWVRVQDKAGNDYGAGWTFFVDTVAPTPPTVTVTSPTNDTTPTFTFNGANDPAPSSGLASYTIEIWSGGAKVRGPYSVAYAADPFSWTVPDADALTPDGSYEIRVWAVDAAGNVSATYGSATVVIDTARPVLANGSPTGYVATTTNTMFADFTDVGVGLDTKGTSLTVSNAGIPRGTWTTGFTGTSYVDGSLSTTIELTLGGFWDGEWTVDMTAHDLAGNKSTPDPTLRWTFNVDTTPPTDPGSPVAGNLGDDGKWYINTLRPTFSWAASTDPAAPDGTPGSGLRDYTFQFGTSTSKPASSVDMWPGALVNQSGIVPTPGVSVQQWTPAADLPLSAGVEYAGRVKAFDNVDNASGWADPLIIYDPDPPTAPGTPSTTTPTNDPTPVWTWAGSTDAISGVDLYHIQIRRAGSVDWDVLDTVLDIPDSLNPGTQTWEQGLQLQDGGYEIRVQAMDVAGNYSAWSGIGTVTVDTTPPAVPGMPQTTSPTNDSTPTWSWGAVSGAASYNVYLDDVLVGNQAGTSYTPSSALSDGQHYLQVSSLDTLGNESAKSEAGYVVIDTTPPAAPAMLPLPSYTNASSVDFIWSQVTDAVKYDFSYSLDGGTTWTTVANLTVQTYTVDISALADGAVVKGKAVAYDAVGNVSAESNVVSTIVDRTGPVVSVVTTPTSPTNNPRPTWEWSGSDAVSGVKGYMVTLDGQAAGWTTDNSFTPSSDLADGEHVLRVVGVDNAGNETQLEFPTVTIDATAPDTPVMTDEEEFTQGTTNVVSWSVVSGAAKYHVQCSEDSTFATLDFEDSNVTTTSWEFMGLDDGVTYYYRVRAIDEVGNASFWSNIVSSTQDATPPQPIGSMPTITPLVTNGDVLTFQWQTAIDEVSGIGEYTLELSYLAPDGTEDTNYEVLPGEVTTYTASDAPEGRWMVRARAVDKVGNQGDDEYWSPWSLPAIVDRTAPPVPAMVTEPQYTPGTSNMVSWNAVTDSGVAEAVSGLAGYDVQMSTDPGFSASPVIQSLSADATSATFVGLAPGQTYYYRVRAKDKAGNVSDWSEATSSTQDPMPLTAPVMAAEPEFTPGTSNTVSWGAVSGADRYHVQCSTDSTFATIVAEDENVTSASKTFASLTDGTTYYYRVRAVDVDASTPVYSGWSNIVHSTQDASGPSVPGRPAVAASPTNNPRPSWTWAPAVDAGSGVAGYQVRLLATDETVIAEAWIANSTSWSPASDLADGQYGLQVRAKDRFDQVGEWSEIGYVVIDRTPPVITMINPAQNGVTLNTTTSSTILARLSGDYASVLVKVDQGQWKEPTAILSGGLLFHFLVPSLLPGEHTVRIKVADELGNTAEVIVTFTVEGGRLGFGFGRFRFEEAE